MPLGLSLEHIAVVIIIAVAVIAFLFCLACRLRFELDLHDLRVAAHTLRLDHKRRLDAMQRGNVELGQINVDIIDD